MHDVESVIDRWPANDHSYFRVRTVDGGDYILPHDERNDAWQIHFLDVSSAEHPEGASAGEIEALT